jgi:hypothetical protein
MEMCPNQLFLPTSLTFQKQYTSWVQILKGVLLTLIEIGQNLTTLFTTTCDYLLFAITFEHFCNYLFCLVIFAIIVQLVYDYFGVHPSM